MWYVGDDSSHLLFNEANLNYHHLHTTYTTGVHAIYCIAHLKHIKCTQMHILLQRLILKKQTGSTCEYHKQ